MDETMQSVAAERRETVQKCLWLSMLLVAMALLAGGVSAADQDQHHACADAATPSADTLDERVADPAQPPAPAGCSRPTDGDRSANPSVPGPRLKPLLRERLEQAPGTVVREDRRRLPA